MIMMSRNVSFEVTDRVATLSINRPQNRNMLNKETRLELRSLLDSIQKDPNIGVLVVTGSGSEFFMSGDLEELSKMSSLELFEFLDTLGQRLYTRFEQIDIPVIAAINGLCAGAGVEIAMACDLRIAADHVRIGLPEIQLGVMPAGGATQRLTRLVGAGKAKELLFTGDFIDAYEARTLGLVNRVVPANELRRAVLDLAHRIAGNSATALKMLKRCVNMAHESSQSSALLFEALSAVTNWNHPDRQEGIEAFFAKRTPKLNQQP